MEDKIDDLSNIEIKQKNRVIPINLIKHFLFIVLGLIIITGSIFVGMQIEKRRESLIQTETDSTSSNTSSRNETPSPTTKIDYIPENWNSYKDSLVGFEFFHPSNLIINNNQKDKINLNIQIKDLSNYEDEPMGLDLGTALLDKKSLETGDFIYANTNNSYPEARKVIKIDDGYFREDISFQQLEVCDVRFVRNLFFYHNNYQIIITLSAPENFKEKMPNYFVLDQINCGESLMWKSNKQFYADLVNKRAPIIAQDWYDTFDKIISTIKLIN